MMLEEPQKTWSFYQGSDNELKLEMLRELCDYGFQVEPTPGGLVVRGQVRIIIPTKEQDDVEFRVTA